MCSPFVWAHALPLAALFLVLTGALIHALWNIAAKKAGGDARFTFFCAAAMFVFWSPLSIWLGWHVVPTWGWLEWTVIAISGFVHWLYFICLLTGYRKSDLTVVYPVARGSGPLLSSGVAVIVFGEKFSAFGAMGIAGVVIGVFLIAGGPALFRAAQDPFKRERIISGMLWGALTGSLIACYTILDAWAVKVLMLSPSCLITGAMCCACRTAPLPCCGTSRKPGDCGQRSGNMR